MDIKQFLQGKNNFIDINEYENLYYLVLKYLQNEQETDKLNHYLIRNKDINDESLMAELEVAIDKDYDTLYNLIRLNYWNSSIKNDLLHLKDYQNSITNPNDQITSDIMLEDIKNANAGLSFDIDGPYVKPD